MPQAQCLTAATLLSSTTGWQHQPELACVAWRADVAAGQDSHNQPVDAVTLAHMTAPPCHSLCTSTYTYIPLSMLISHTITEEDPALRLS